MAALASGVDPDLILAGAKAYAAEQAGNEPRYVAYSENWVAKGRWIQFTPAPVVKVDESVLLKSWAKRIKSGQCWVVGHIDVAMANELVSCEYVTADECRAVGVQL